MKNKKINKLLSACALYLYCMLSITNANAQEAETNKQDTIYSRKHSRFLRTDSETVAEFSDTLLVYAIYPQKFIHNSQQWTKPDTNKNNEPIINPEYFRTSRWLPQIQPDDTTAFNLIVTEDKLIEKYHYYQTIGDYQNRDSIGEKLMANRQKLVNHAIVKQNNK